MPSALNGDQPVAAVDLGSNSFHAIIARELGNQVAVLDRLRDPVRLAAGLDGDGKLDDAAIERMSAALAKFRERLREIPPERVRAIGTDTFRRVRAPKDLLLRASDTLGFTIEVLSGTEEARLIYLGVSHEEPEIAGKRLVVDIGGGSTECILGRNFSPIFADSLRMGCVGYTQRFFGDGKLSRKAFRKAEIAARIELETMERRYRRSGWQDCVGSSGTIVAISEALRSQGWTDGRITLSALEKLREALIDRETVARVDLPAVTADRREVLAGGLTILIAAFESLEIETMRASKAALREGLLYDLLGRMHREDARDRTIRGLSERFSVDQKHAARVERTALRALEQVQRAWGLESQVCAQLLGWAARVHEIGLSLSYSGHHKHGAYILANSDMPGFSRQEQTRLAALVREHRRKLTSTSFAEFSPNWQERLLRLCVLLRLAVRLNRARRPKALPPFQLSASSGGLEIRFSKRWLENHPLTRADLGEEDELLAGTGVRLSVAES